MIIISDVVTDKHFTMAGNVCVCSLDPELEQQLTEFRFRKETNTCAVIMKVSCRDIIVTIMIDDFKVDKAS